MDGDIHKLRKGRTTPILAHLIISGDGVLLIRGPGLIDTPLPNAYFFHTGCYYTLTECGHSEGMGQTGPSDILREEVLRP